MEAHRQDARPVGGTSLPATTTPAPAGFRPDIQGVRAVAVLLVVVHHLGGLGVPGGYVGVDVFLVVSGYLITGLLLRDAERTGRVSLTGFYARRARRILPAATLVTAVTVGVSLLALPLVQVQTVVVDALWSTLFAANVRFASVGTDYFAQGEPPSPLQHYWSLAVEEQFYLLWPLLVLLVAIAARRRPVASRDRARTRLLWVVLAVVLVASVAWSVTATTTSPTTAYFSTPARAWELGAGAACALLLHRGPLRLGRAGREVLGATGLLAVLAAALLYTPQTPFPGTAAALPVAGTVLLVLAGGRPGATTWTERLLSVRPATAVGAWSFSVYLWHWPAIIVARALTPGPLDLLDQGALLAGVLVLAWGTYRLVETPFRRGVRWHRTGPALVIYPVSLVLVAGVAGLTHAVADDRLENGGGGDPIALGDYRAPRAGDPFVGLVGASVRAAQEGRDIPGGLTPGLDDLREAVAPLGACDYRTGTRELCSQGDAGAERTVVLIGDSYARALSPALDQVGADEGYRVHTLVYSGCMATGLVQVERETGEPWTDCEEFKDWALETIGGLEPDLVVVATHAAILVDPATGEGVVAADGREEYLGLLSEGYERLLGSLTPVADRVAVVAGTPRLERGPAACLSDGGTDLGDCALPPQPRAASQARVLMRAGRDAGATVVDAQRWFCGDDLCPAVVGPYVTLRDKEHMTPEYARFVAPSVAVALGLADELPGSLPDVLSGAVDPGSRSPDELQG